MISSAARARAILELKRRGEMVTFDDEDEEDRLRYADGADGCVAWIRECCRIENGNTGLWVPFELYPEQEQVIRELFINDKLCILKARQLGITWLMLCVALWLMLFQPISHILAFSYRQKEAAYLVTKIRGVYDRLPVWQQIGIKVDSKHEFVLANDSRIAAFAPTGGDSYTAKLVLIDEADLIVHFAQLIGRVMPTIDMGGKIVVFSRSNKRLPQSRFKAIFREGWTNRAKGFLGSWRSIFLPWSVRPERNEEWYKKKEDEHLKEHGSKDELYAHYPATPDEALKPNELDKRYPPEWLSSVFVEEQGLDIKKISGLPAELLGTDLKVYRIPVPGRSYVIGADPAEGIDNNTSDDSSITILDRETCEEVAQLTAQIEPDDFANYINILGEWYNGSPPMVERNNHGHAVISWLRQNSYLRMPKMEDKKPGYQTNTKSKVLLFTLGAEMFRDKACIIHSLDTYLQLQAIEKYKLKAPEGEHDDRAVSYLLALKGATLPQPGFK